METPIDSWVNKVKMIYNKFEFTINLHQATDHSVDNCIKYGRFEFNNSFIYEASNKEISKTLITIRILLTLFCLEHYQLHLQIH